MKNIILPITLAIAFLALPATPTHAYSQAPVNGDGNNRFCKDPTPVPEPGSFALVGIGLLALSGFVLVGRKKSAQADNR
jgi:PEP-CTERM motif